MKTGIAILLGVGAAAAGFFFLRSRSPSFVLPSRIVGCGCIPGFEFDFSRQPDVNGCLPCIQVVNS